MSDVSASFGRIGDGMYLSQVNVKGSGTTLGYGLDDTNDGGVVKFKTVSKLLSEREISFERTIAVKSLYFLNMAVDVLINLKTCIYVLYMV